MNTMSQLGKKKRFWRWKEVTLHNNVNVLIAQNCTFQKMVKMVNYTLRIFYHNFSNGHEKTIYKRRHAIVIKCLKKLFKLTDTLRSTN